MAGFVFTGVLGTLLHFLFDWTGGNSIAALFSAVNESIWEHLKLLFYPMVAVALTEYCFWGRGTESFWCVKLTGILTGLALIPLIYYTYTGILGVNADWFNIAIFFLSAAAAYRLETALFQSNRRCLITEPMAVFLLLLMILLFTALTFVTPKIPLFRDPLTGTYGFSASASK